MPGATKKRKRKSNSVSARERSRRPKARRRVTFNLTKNQLNMIARLEEYVEGEMIYPKTVTRRRLSSK